MALLTGAPRNATVVAQTAGKCLALEKAAFDRVVGPLKRLVEMAEQRSMLTNISVLKNLSELERLNAVRRFKLATFKKGAVRGCRRVGSMGVWAFFSFYFYLREFLKSEML